VAKKRPDRLTPAEAQIMDCLWGLGEGTAREVKKKLDGRKPVAYTTVQTIMSILRDKGFVESRREGRADVYRPLVGREEVGGSRLRDVIQLFFAGSAAAVVSHLVESDDVTQEEIQAMRQAVSARARGR
jgi:BlaI family penicillinase repressor